MYNRITDILYKLVFVVFVTLAFANESVFLLVISAIIYLQSVEIKVEMLLQEVDNG